MRRLLWIMVTGLIIFTFGCQSTEEVTLSKYFQALKAKDNDTLAAMCAEPIEIVFKSWKVAKIEEPVSEPLPLVALILKRDELKAKRDQELDFVRQKRENLDLLKSKISDTSNRRAKAELEAQLPEAEQMEKAAMDSFKVALGDFQQAEKEIKEEKKLFSLSTGITTDPEAFTAGSASTSVVHVTIVTPDDQTKGYKITMRKYIVDIPGTDRKQNGRLVIVKFEAE
jgi:hypothetical protein